MAMMLESNSGIGIRNFWNRGSLINGGPYELHAPHWVGYQNPEPFVWFVLIDQVPDIWSRFPELAQIKTSQRKGSGFWYPTQCPCVEAFECEHVVSMIFKSSSFANMPLMIPLGLTCNRQ